MVKAVFFDFNGTLYFDQDINKETWKQTIKELSNDKIDFESFFSNRKAVMDYIVIEDAFKMINKKYTNKEIEHWVNYKENKYRQYGIDHKRTVLAPGAERVLNDLISREIKLILCTSSIKENVEYYFKYFNLSKWFDFDETVYDTGDYKNKSEMYKECFVRTKTKAGEVVVFEDSAKSISEAINAGVTKVVAINQNESLELNEVKQSIRDFNELDFSIFD